MTTLAAASLLFAVSLSAPAMGQPVGQPVLVAKAKPIINVEGLQFKDLNANARLDPYEDWRLPAPLRADDLVRQMTLAEKAGMLLIATNNPACGGGLSPEGRALIEQEQMTRFILRSRVVATAPDCTQKLEGFAARQGYSQTPLQMANYTNDVQQMREASRLGIPALFKDNARNHVETNPLFGIAQGAGLFTEFPKEAGLAAAALGRASPPRADGYIPATLKGDMSVLQSFAKVMATEWTAIGLRGMYGYMADLATEPRWSRVHETFSEDADLVSDIMASLVGELQGPVHANGLALSPQSAVAMTVKHFPGGGPQQMGWDPHYSFGKNQLYTDKSGKYGFGYHLKPFVAAINAGASSVMPYYGVPLGADYQGQKFDALGMAFSRQIIDDLLRKKLGFRGYVNSDSGIIEQRGWGLESSRINPATGAGYSVADRTAIAVRVGTDVLSEFRKAKTITDLVESGKLDEQRDVNLAVHRLLQEQFLLGLFENPYVDAEAAALRIGQPANRALGLEVQRQSVVLLKNDAVLPIKPGSNVFTLGFKAQDVARYASVVVDGNRPDAPSPKGSDIVLIKVMVDNRGAAAYVSNDPKTGGQRVAPRFGLINPATGKLQRQWGEQDPCVYDPKGEGAVEGCIDAGLRFGGSFPWEVDLLSISGIAKAQSWTMTPSLADIRRAMKAVGDPRRVVLSIYFRSPYVLDQKSGFLNAGALIGTFGVSDAAQLDVIFGKAQPQGRLPFALPKTVRAVQEQSPDAPGYAETRDGALFPYGFGLGYQ
jgi:beta-glucosidase